MIVPPVFCYLHLIAFYATVINRVALSVNDTYKNYSENDSGLLLKALNAEKYSRFQNDPRMQKIMETLKTTAML